MKKIINKVQNHRLIKQYPTGIQMIKFAMVGVINFIIDFSVYMALTRLFDFWQRNYLVANIVAFAVAVTFSFFVNKHWTFKCRKKDQMRRQYVQFFVICLMGLGWTELILYVGVDIFQYFDVYIKLLATFLVFFWNFGINKLWTFKR